MNDSFFSDEDDRGQEGSRRDPLEALATEFAERYRQGDEVSVEEYARMHPTLADQIRKLFPTIAAMERLTTKQAREAALATRSKPKQLGDYLIVEEIARGGMGIIYEAEQISLGRRVAVKVLPSHYLSRMKDIQRFHREAHTAANLHHSNIVPVFGVGEENGQHYIVMQLIRGVGLDEVLEELKRVFVEGSSPHEPATSAHRISQAVRSASSLIEGALETRSETLEANIDTVEIPIPSGPSKRPASSKKWFRPTRLRAPLGKSYFQSVAKIGRQAAEALAYAHQHDTLHRDIKPGNLLLDQEGRVWVADFGLAKAVQDQDVTKSGDLVGTIAYVAPERFQGKTTKASDVYSLGVTLHEMLTLQKAFRSDDRVEVLNQVTTHGLPEPSKLNRGVPRDLETIVMKATATDPSDRYASAGLLAEDLTAFLEDRPIGARRMSYVEHGTRWCRRNKTLTAMACGMVALIVAAMASLTAGYRHARLQHANAERSMARAERSEARAIGVIEEIYDYFAPVRYSGMDEELIEEDTSGSLLMDRTPISKHTAVMLENLLSYYDELAADAAQTGVIAHKAISANRRVGDIHRRLDQFEDARTSYEHAIQRLQQLPAELLDSSAMRIETSRIYNGYGLAQGHFRFRDRTANHQKAVDVLDPNSESPEERFQLATSLYLLHSSRRSRRYRDEPNGNKDLQEAKSILSTLVENSRDNVDYNLLMARCLLASPAVKSSDCSPSADQASQETVEDARQLGLQQLKQLVSEHPQNPDLQFELGSAILRRNYRGRRGRERYRQDAEAQLREALAATKNLEGHHPNIPEYYRLKKNLHEVLGRILEKDDRLSEAIAEYDHSERMQRLLITHAEDPVVHRYFLYKLQLEFGQVLYEAQEYDRAKEMLLQSAKGFEEFVRDSDTTPDRWYGRLDETRGRLELSYRRLEKVARATGFDDEATDWLRMANELE